MWISLSSARREGKCWRDRMDLRQFIDRLESHGELQRIAAEVDPYLEIAAITDRISKAAGGGRALLFERVGGHRVPVAINLFGSRRRSLMALGDTSLVDLIKKLSSELDAATGSGAERLRSVLARPGFTPEQAGDAPWRECAEPALDFSHLPALQSWPGDAGRFLTLPQVFTCDPDTGERNCGMYRMQIFDERNAGIRWRPGSDAARHYAAWQRRKEKRMPVAVALGGDPALIYGACASLPPGIDEVRYAGFLRGEPLVMAACACGDLAVPASAEFVLEGYVEPDVQMLEGPFGNHTGYYSAPGPCPVFRLVKMYHRRGAIYPCTLVGPPPMENCWLAKLNERLLLPLLRCDFPQIVDINFPTETIFHGCALLSVRQAGEDASSLLRKLWASRYFRFAPMLVLLGEDVDVQNVPQAYWTVVNRIDPARDVIIEAGRVGIDATGAGDGRKVEVAEETNRLVARRWQEYGFASDTCVSDNGDLR